MQSYYLLEYLIAANEMTILRSVFKCQWIQLNVNNANMRAKFSLGQKILFRAGKVQPLFLPSS